MTAEAATMPQRRGPEDAMTALSSLLDQAAAGHPDRHALRLDDLVPTRAHLREAAGRMATLLASHGIAPTSAPWCRGGVRLGLAPRRGLLEQPAELDLRGPFGLTGFPQADLPTRQRISPGVDTNAERTAGELLNVTACGLSHDSTIIPPGVPVPRLAVPTYVLPGGAPGGRTLNQWVKSPLLCH